MKVIIFKLTLKTLIFIFSSFVYSQELNEKYKEIDVDFAVRGTLNYDENIINIIDFLDKSIATKTTEEINSFWFEDDNHPLSEPYNDYWVTVNGNGYFKPTLIALTKLNENEYQARLALMGRPNDFNSLLYIYNVKVIKNDNSFKLKSLSNETINNLSKRKIQNISFLNSNDNLIKEENYQIEFDSFYSKLLDKPKLDYTVVVTKGYSEIEKILGYDYTMEMYLNSNVGGLAYPKDKIFFCGNGKAFHFHETVHIYNHHYFPNLNPMVDEGTAVYFGGSIEKKYTEHLETLKKFLINNPQFSIKDTIFDEVNKYYRIDDFTSFYYSISALFVDLVYNKKGSEGLNILLSTPNDNTILIKNLENLLDFKWENIDQFIKEN